MLWQILSFVRSYRSIKNKCAQKATDIVVVIYFFSKNLFNPHVYPYLTHLQRPVTKEI